MSEIFLNPEALQTQIDSSNTTNDAIALVKYDINTNTLSLDSIDKFIECIDALNILITDFTTMYKNDLNSLQISKAMWLNIDESLANTTLGGYVEEKIKP